MNFQMTQSARMFRSAAMVLAGVTLLAAAGCGNKNVPVTRVPEPVKQVAVTTPPPPPPAVVRTPAAQTPVIDSFTADPTRMERGQSATLRWAVSNATEITIDQGLGAVQASGSRQVFPGTSMTYTLTARSAAGAVQRQVTVEVVAAPAPPTSTVSSSVNPADRLRAEAQDVLFAYDSSEISADGQRALRNNADLLMTIFAANPTFNVVLEGHCDERGSSEYNLGLGDRRATTVRDGLVRLGVPADRIRTLSYGKERPVCTEANEACYQLNRRGHLSPAQ